MQIYQAERPDWRVRVYNLLYEDSQEADKFSAAVAREVWSPLFHAGMVMSWLLCMLDITKVCSACCHTVHILTQLCYCT